MRLSSTEDTVDIQANRGSKPRLPLNGLMRPKGLGTVRGERRSATLPEDGPAQLLSGSEVRPEGLEPPAYWFEASRSIQLSYGRRNKECSAAAAARTRFDLRLRALCPICVLKSEFPRVKEH
jgi:hypothetical protein